VFKGLDDKPSVHKYLRIINILVHHNNGQPVYIALSDRMTFEIIYLRSARSSHNFISEDVKSATTELITASYSGESNWILMGN
jgi:hypothetical protein